MNIDHRRGIAFDGDVISYIRAAWDVAPDVKRHIEAVHRLTDLGALVSLGVAWDLASRLQR